MKLILLILFILSCSKSTKIEKPIYSEIEIIDSINTERYIIYFCEDHKNKLITLISDRDTSMSMRSKFKIKIGEKYNFTLLESDSSVKDLFFHHLHPILLGTNVSLKEFGRIKNKLNINYPVKNAVRGQDVLRNDSIYKLEMSIKEDSVNILKNKNLDSDLKYYYRFFFMDSHFYTTKDLTDEYYMGK